MKNSSKFFDSINFNPDLDLDFEPGSKKVISTPYDIIVYEGSNNNFFHPLIEKYDYSIKKDQNYTSLNIHIKSKKENEVLKRVLKNNNVSANFFESLGNNFTIDKISLEDEMILEYIKSNDKLIIQIFKFNR